MTQFQDLDEIKVDLLQLIMSPFGLVGAAAVMSYVVWKKVMSYVEGARDAARIGRRARSWLERQLQRRAGELWFAITTTVVMLFVQAAWVGSTFVVGNDPTRNSQAGEVPAIPAMAPRRTPTRTGSRSRNTVFDDRGIPAAAPEPGTG